MKKLFIVSFSVLILGGISAFGFSHFSDKKVEADEKVRIERIEGDPIADFNDKKILVGSTDYVFIGKVISQKGQINLHLPITQFNVKILKEIKGNFNQDEVVISQYGGYTEDEEGNKILTVFEDDHLLDINKKYMFTANKQKDGNILIIPEYGNVKIKDINHQNVLDKEFEEAYKNQEVPEVIKNRKSKNP